MLLASGWIFHKVCLLPTQMAIYLLVDTFKATIALVMFRGKQHAFMSLLALLCERSSCPLSQWTTSTLDEIQTERDTTYLKACKQETKPGAETLPLTYL